MVVDEMSIIKQDINLYADTRFEYDWSFGSDEVDSNEMDWFPLFAPSPQNRSQYWKQIMNKIAKKRGGSERAHRFEPDLSPILSLKTLNY